MNKMDSNAEADLVSGILAALFLLSCALAGMLILFWISADANLRLFGWLNRAMAESALGYVGSVWLVTGLLWLGIRMRR